MVLKIRSPENGNKYLRQSLAYMRSMAEHPHFSYLPELLICTTQYSPHLKLLRDPPIQKDLFPYRKYETV